MQCVSQSAVHRKGTGVFRYLASSTAAVFGLLVVGGVQAATLSCSAPLRVTTTSASGWHTDAKLVTNPTVTATVVDNYLWGGWYNPATQTPPLSNKWLSFGAGNAVNPATSTSYPVVNTVGDTANGAWVSGRTTFIYNETITVAPNVDLSTIKVKGTGSADNDALFVVKPGTLPGNVANSTWLKTTPMLGGTWTAPANIDLSAGNLGFYYGDNTIGFATSSESTTANYPTGVIADLEITADCRDEPPPQPTASLVCPVGNKLGDTVRIGPFTTNARDWKWTWRTNATSNALENVQQPLFDDYRYRDYFNPGNLPAGSETKALWISPGTVDPSGTDVPGVPYPVASGQTRPGFNAAVFMLNQPINIGSNVDLASIKFDGRFAFDDTGDSVFVQPAGKPGTYGSFLLPDGYGAFTTYTTASIPGFERGQNSFGLMLDGGQFSNNCNDGVCAMAAIADFYVTASCTGVDPVVTSATPVPTLGAAGMGLLGLLSAGIGALMLRRRNRPAR